MGLPAPPACRFEKVTALPLTPVCLCVAETGLSRDVMMREISLMTFFSSMMTSFQLKPPRSFPLHPPQSYPAPVSSFSISWGFDGRRWVSAALSARRGKLIRDQIHRAAPEESGVSLPLPKGCPAWAGGREVPPGKYDVCISRRSQSLPSAKPLRLCSFAPPEGMAPAPEKPMHRGCEALPRLVGLESVGGRVVGRAGPPPRFSGHFGHGPDSCRAKSGCLPFHFPVALDIPCIDSLGTV